MTDRPTMHLVFDTDTDDRGRASFTLYWHDGERRHAQCYRCNVDEFLKHTPAIVHETDDEAKTAAWGATT